MNNSNLLIYTFKESLYCCCFIQGSFMACCSKRALIVWDFTLGKMISQLQFGEELSPIAISVIYDEGEEIGLLLQLKQTKVLLLIYNKSNKKVTKSSHYQLQMIGFTKLSVASYVYNENYEVNRQIKKDFFTISYPNRIQKRSLLQGNIKQSFQIEENTLEDVCYILTYQILDITYLLIAQQGARLKLFVMPNESSQLSVSKTMQLESKEIKIVLSIQPIANCKAFVCMRNSNLCIVNLKELYITQTLNLKGYRLIKTIPNRHQETYAIVSKSEMGIFKKRKLECVEKVGKSLMMDIDTFELGVIGVSQQGKIVLLALFD